MKKYILILITISLLTSCERNFNREEIPNDMTKRIHIIERTRFYTNIVYRNM